MIDQQIDTRSKPLSDNSELVQWKKRAKVMTISTLISEVERNHEKRQKHDYLDDLDDADPA